MIRFLRSRVALAVLGVIIIGGGSAAVAAWSAGGPFFAVQGASQTNSQVSGIPPAATSTDRSGSDDGQETATSPSSNELIDLYGYVVSVDRSASTFTLRSHGSLIAIVVAPQTTFSGKVASLNALSSGMGVEVEVQPQPRSDGSYLATEVYAGSDD